MWAERAGGCRASHYVAGWGGAGMGGVVDWLTLLVLGFLLAVSGVVRVVRERMDAGVDGSIEQIRELQSVLRSLAVGSGGDETTH